MNCGKVRQIFEKIESLGNETKNEVEARKSLIVAEPKKSDEPLLALR